MGDLEDYLRHATRTKPFSFYLIYIAVFTLLSNHEIFLNILNILNILNVLALKSIY
jgi:hypothetical protein